MANKQKIKSIAWKEAALARYKGIDVKKVYREIGEKPITPEEVVEKARNEKTELHKCFEWNDTIAGQKYREQQARHILINIVVEYEDIPTPQPTRAYSITTEQKVYAPTRIVLQKPDEYQALLERARMELEAYKRKYANLTELADIVQEVFDL